MKKRISLALVAALLVLTMGAMAESGAPYIYGTMQIPYDAFYAAEGITGEVDAVTSATNSKWQQTDGLAAGTYNIPHESDEGGDILGVVYPVAIAQGDLDALGEDNCGFTPIDETPAAYKIATVQDGALSFSAVQGETAAFDAEVTLSTDTPWGDYLLDVAGLNNADGTSEIGTIYGALIRTSDGSAYAMRHLQNIWRDELAWSTGFTTVEPHGSALSYAAYEDMMGKTISGITYITDTGYHTLDVDLYVPIKFDGGVEVANAATADGSAAVTLTNIPEDFSPAFSIDGLDAQIDAENITFADALPGQYTLIVRDDSGKYAPISADFVLSTDVLPVVFDAETSALVPAENADAELAAAFIANLSTVTVGDEEYAASGRGAVSVINLDGAVDPEAARIQGRGPEAEAIPVFPESGEYTITAAATGFEQTITFTVVIEK